MKLIKEIDKMTEAKLKKALFVGRLAGEDDIVNTMIDAPITFQDDLNEFLLFHVKCLSEVPEELSKYFLYHNRIFRGSTRSNINVHKIKNYIPNYDRLLPVDRKKRLGEVLQNKLIVFTLSQINMNIYLEIVKLEDVEPKEGYFLIPQPNLALNHGREDLEVRILEGKPISLTFYPNLFKEPEFIYCDNYLYSNLIFKQADIPTTYYVSNPDEVRRMQVSHDFFKHVDTRIDSSLLILNHEAVLDLRDQIEHEGTILWESFQRTPEKPKAAEPPEPGIDPIEEPKPAPSQPYRFHEDEIRFIEQLEQNAQARGLFYDPDDLLNLHISVKTNLLTIIGGMSGTGKSQLARLYGETLNLKMGETMAMVPVSPAYHEPNDILGYLNPTTGVYHESETGLVSLLLHAQQYPEQLHMVIFDEMNLSQVEHWFSPFISLIEVESDKRKLSLFHSGAYCINEKYRAQISLGDNLIFVGTINFDETTKGFSDRLLDRANVIVPRKLTFREVRSRQLPSDPSSELQTFPHVDINTFRGEWLSPQGDLDGLTDAEVDVLDAIHTLMEQQDRQRGISFRVARAIAKYIANIPANHHGHALLDRGLAFDLQLKQRVLTKLSGSDTVVGELLGSYQEDQYQEGRIAEVLLSAEAQQISTFKFSLELIKQKAIELMIHGYTN